MVPGTCASSGRFKLENDCVLLVFAIEFRNRHLWLHIKVYNRQGKLLR